jgi:glutaredoxin
MQSDFMEANRTLNVVLYTREGCHLCETALEVLTDFGISPIVVDIDADSMLQQRFDTSVPVVEINARIRFRGRVEPALLQRILATER